MTTPIIFSTKDLYERIRFLEANKRVQDRAVETYRQHLDRKQADYVSLLEENAALRKVLDAVCGWTSECSTCEGSGLDPDDGKSACFTCGGYGFNPSGDIREAILEARALLQKAGE